MEKLQVERDLSMDLKNATIQSQILDNSKDNSSVISLNELASISGLSSDTIQSELNLDTIESLSIEELREKMLQYLHNIDQSVSDLGK